MTNAFRFSVNEVGVLQLTPAENGPKDFEPIQFENDTTPLDLDGVHHTMLDAERGALSFARDARFALNIAVHPEDLAGMTRADNGMLVIGVVPDVSDASFGVECRTAEDKRALVLALRALADDLEDACDDEDDEEAEEAQPQRLSA